MKILHYAPFMQAGGGSRLAVDLSYALQTTTQSTLAVPCGFLSPADVSAPQQQRVVDYNDPLLPGVWGHVLKLRGLIRSHKPDILQAYGYEAIIIAAKARKLIPAAQRPRLVGALTGYPASAETLRRPEIAACDSITVISKQLRQFIKKANPALIKSWVIPYGVNETLCYPTYRSPQGWQEHWQSKHPELKGRFVVCVPGPLSEMHGSLDIVPITATLLQQNIPVQILIAGKPSHSESAFLTQLRRRCRSSGIEQLISWEEHTDQLRDIMCSCHAVISISTAPEAYNRPVLEALALGRPVVGYDHGSVGEYLDAFQPIGTVPVGDFDAVADVLSQWHTYPPDPVESIPYPYRLSDTAKSYYDLYTSLN